MRILSSTILMKFPSRTEDVLTKHIPFTDGIHCTFSGFWFTLICIFSIEKCLGMDQFITMTLIWVLGSQIGPVKPKLKVLSLSWHTWVWMRWLSFFVSIFTLVTRYWARSFRFVTGFRQKYIPLSYWWSS